MLLLIHYSPLRSPCYRLPHLYLHHYTLICLVVPHQIRIPQSHVYILNKRIQFESTQAWNLPVLDDENKYLGFVSKSQIFSSYRDQLKAVSDE